MAARIDGAPLSPKQIALSLNVSADVVYRLLNDGALRGVRVGRQWRITEDALADYLARPARPEPQPVDLRAIMERRLLASGGAR
jgi:excisionase family DNA binding protein